LPLPNLDCAVDEALGAAPGGALCCSEGCQTMSLSASSVMGIQKELVAATSPSAHKEYMAGMKKVRHHRCGQSTGAATGARTGSLACIQTRVTENDTADHARCCDVAVLLGAAVAPRAGAHCSQRPGTAHSDPQQVHPCHLHDRGEPGARRGKWPGLVQTNAAEQTQTCTAAATGPIDRSPPEFDELRRASAVGSKSQPPRPQMATPQRCRQV
jgi:hypothetical protein